MLEHAGPSGRTSDPTDPGIPSGEVSAEPNLSSDLQASNLRPLEQTPLGQLVRSLGLTHAYFDLDLTLVDSRPVYLSLEMATCAAFGFSDRNLVYERHMDLIARSSEEIMRGMYDLSGGPAKTGVSFEEFHRFYKEKVRRLFHGEDEPELSPERIECAHELVLAVKELDLIARVATGSNRHMAELLLRNTDLDSHFNLTSDMTCSDDTPMKKHEPGFWEHVRGEVAGEKIVGFEDNPEASRWMLEHGGFAHVYLRAPEPQAEICSLLQDHQDRIQVVPCWSEILNNG